MSYVGIKPAKAASSRRLKWAQPWDTRRSRTFEASLVAALRDCSRSSGRASLCKEVRRPPGQRQAYGLSSAHYCTVADRSVGAFGFCAAADPPNSYAP
jgi:hypothetical protein